MAGHRAYAGESAAVGAGLYLEAGVVQLVGRGSAQAGGGAGRLGREGDELHG